ncbi:hypothetical protein M885DRAFT_552277 [Pelagophyceae sp. CCMP2097]|nr:hypothetical protein M885DRAFT_552277 [Pelagophyceae sp. CCMP2097]
MPPKAKAAAAVDEVVKQDFVAKGVTYDKYLSDSVNPTLAAALKALEEAIEIDLQTGLPRRPLDALGWLATHLEAFQLSTENVALKADVSAAKAKVRAACLAERLALVSWHASAYVRGGGGDAFDDVPRLWKNDIDNSVLKKQLLEDCFPAAIDATEKRQALWFELDAQDGAIGFPAFEDWCVGRLLRVEADARNAEAASRGLDSGDAPPAEAAADADAAPANADAAPADAADAAPAPAEPLPAYYSLVPYSLRCIRAAFDFARRAVPPTKRLGDALSREEFRPALVALQLALLLRQTLDAPALPTKATKAKASAVGSAAMRHLKLQLRSFGVPKQALLAADDEAHGEARLAHCVGACATPEILRALKTA